MRLTGTWPFLDEESIFVLLSSSLNILEEDTNAAL